VDVAHKWGAEAVDEELDRLIAKRASQDRRPDPNEQEERWKMSVAAYEQALRLSDAERRARDELEEYYREHLSAGLNQALG
jgi:hypothetical protein